MTNMKIRFKLKSAITAVLAVILGIIVITLSVFGYNYYTNAQKAWADKTNWENPQLTFLDSNDSFAGNFSMDEQSKKLTYQVDYCALYIVKSTDKDITYYCTLLPYKYIIERGLDKSLGMVGGIQINPDITFTYLKGTDPAPGKFLDIQVLSNASFDTDVGETAVPVKMKLEFTYTAPSGDLLKMIQHYQNVLAGKKSKYEVKLSSWEFEKVPTVDEYFAEAPKQKYKDFLKKWADDAYADFEKMIDVDKYLKGTKTDVIQNMLPELAVSEIFCATSYNRASCGKQFSADGPTNFLFYLYATGYKDKQKFQLYLDALNARHFPFAKPVADKDGKILNTFKFEQYPVCPIVELTMGKVDSPQVAFFKTFYRNYGLMPPLDPQKVDAATINAAQMSLTNELYSGTPARLVDVMCDQFIANNEKAMKTAVHHNSIADDTERRQLFTLLGTRFGVMFEGVRLSNKTSSGKINSVAYPTDEWIEAMAKRVYVEAYLQPYQGRFLFSDTETRTKVDTQSPAAVQSYNVNKDIIRTLLVMETAYAIQ